MKKLVILLVLLAAAGTAAWLIYRKTPSGPEDKAVLYGNVDLRQVDLAFLISERIDSVLVDEGDTVVPGQKLATLETVRLRQAADEARQIAEAARQNYLRVKNGPRAEGNSPGEGKRSGRGSYAEQRRNAQQKAGGAG